MPDEKQRWAKLNMPGQPPVWSTKEETDASYRLGMEMVLNTIAARREDSSSPDVAAIFATHNEVSVEEAFELLRQTGLGETDSQGRVVVDEHTANSVAFAQFYGMKDGLTNRIAAGVVTPTGLPMVCKVRLHSCCIALSQFFVDTQSAPYGTLEHALPTLARRAQENKAFIEGRSNAVAERKRLGRELCRRYVPMYSSDR